MGDLIMSGDVKWTEGSLVPRPYARACERV